MTPGSVLVRESDSAAGTGTFVGFGQGTDLFEAARDSLMAIELLSATTEETQEFYRLDDWGTAATSVLWSSHMTQEQDVRLGYPQVEAAVRASVMPHPGWLDGEGSATDKEAEARAVALLGALASRGLPTPRIFPTEEGGLQAEWSVGGRELSVAFEPDGTLYAIAVDVSSGKSEDLVLTGDDPSAILGLLLPGSR